MTERMSERLATQRRHGFVGRRREIDTFLRLVGDAGQGSVLFVSGPGGVGKTTLLTRFAALAADAGRLVVRVDGRDVAPVRSALLAEIATACGCDPAAEPLTALGERSGLVLLVDTAERLTALDRWLREDLLPALSADTVAVLAGREPPSVGWRTDPGWRGLVHALQLDNLTAAESVALLERRGIPAERHAEALAFTHGHPLALALVADVIAQGGDQVPPAHLPGVMTALLSRLVDTVPTSEHRRALEACAQVLTLSEPLLAELLQVPDALATFDWLRGLSIIEAGPRGLFPHDVARDALGAELRWRHQQRYADLHRRAGAYYRRRFNEVPVPLRQQVLVDYVFLHRDNPVLGPIVTGSAESGTDLRALSAAPASDAERGLVLDMVERHEGAAASELAGYWISRQPDCVHLIRGPDGDVLGLIGTLALERVTQDDRRRDPAVDRTCAYLDRTAPLREGERAGLFRFWMQTDGYQELGPVQLFIMLYFVGYYLSTLRLAHSFVYYADPDLWAQICAYSDMQRLPEADFEVDNRRYGVYGHDWRTTPPLAWLQLLGERELVDQPLNLGTSTASAGSVDTHRLCDDDFAAAVKVALRDLGQARGLRGSPLLYAPLISARVSAHADTRIREAELRARIREAATRLEASPRERRGFRALHHTYLQPAATQAAAAELLDLPTTTYRRHLATGVARLTELLRQDDLDADRTDVARPAR
ncbi:MAG TPA: AAA family ATPase [Nakamurella sp.]